VVLTATAFDDQGQFSVNGQRADANYFTVDGVSANFGVRGFAPLMQSAAGALRGLSALGGAKDGAPPKHKIKGGPRQPLRKKRAGRKSAPHHHQLVLLETEISVLSGRGLRTHHLLRGIRLPTPRHQGILHLRGTRSQQVRRR
jgi:hypothetical protein